MENEKYWNEKTQPASGLGGNRKGGIIDFDFYEPKYNDTTKTWEYRRLNATSLKEAKTRVEKHRLIARSRHGCKTITKVFMNSKWRDISELEKR